MEGGCETRPKEEGRGVGERTRGGGEEGTKGGGEGAGEGRGEVGKVEKLRGGGGNRKGEGRSKRKKRRPIRREEGSGMRSGGGEEAIGVAAWESKGRRERGVKRGGE